MCAVLLSHISSVRTLHTQTCFETLHFVLLVRMKLRQSLLFWSRLTKKTDFIHECKLISLLQASPAGWVPERMMLSLFTTPPAESSNVSVPSDCL